MTLLPVEAVLLDLDDTLLDTTTAMIAAGQAGMTAVWPGEDDAWYETAARVFRADPGGHFRRYTAGESDFAAMRAARLADVAQAMGRALPDDAPAVYESSFGPQLRANVRLFDDVTAFLDGCVEVGLAVGLLTNSGSPLTAHKLAATGLESRFGVVHTRDTLGFGKPDARVFAMACSVLGVPAERTAYIGDELAADVEGSAAAGLYPVWLRRVRSHTASSAPDAQLADSAAPAQVPVIESLARLRPTSAGLQVADLGTSPWDR